MCWFAFLTRLELSFFLSYLSIVPTLQDDILLPPVVIIFDILRTKQLCENME